jgi:mannobiose 2-epimerase
MMTYDGKVSDGMKHTYNQAFAVYALSAYHLASQRGEPLELAFGLFDLIEEKCASSAGYLEAFTRDWKPAANDALSENGISAEKTMNAILHLIEAYTVLYQASGDIRVKDRLMFLLDITYEKILDKENDKLFVFFDKDMNVLGDIHSYGHDIEASWLIDRACETVGDAGLISRWKEISLKIAENIFNVAYENGAVNYEHDRGNNEEINKKRVWWVQAESVVGFLNAYRNSGDEKFLQAAGTIWEYIKKFQTDKRKGSEWFAETAFDGSPLDACELAGPWKCPYHNGRMCIEAARLI